MLQRPNLRRARITSSRLTVCLTARLLRNSINSARTFSIKLQQAYYSSSARRALFFNLNWRYCAQIVEDIGASALLLPTQRSHLLDHLISTTQPQMQYMMHSNPERCHPSCSIANKLRAEAKCPGTTLSADVCRLYKLI